MMKSAIIILTICVLAICQGQPERSHRTKRDLTCASGGNKLCNFTCKGRGWAEGSCAWDTETGAFNCNCSKTKRGVRCNLGGPNTCYYSCAALGYSSGECDSDFNCKCGGGNNRWGEIIENVRNRL